MTIKFKVKDKVNATMSTNQNTGGTLGLSGVWHIVCRGADGVEKWRDTFKNTIVNAGLDHALDVTLSAATQITTWYVGLTDGTPTVAAGDTMSSHAGWAEVTTYSEANRQTWTDGGVSSQSVTNSASTADFSINGTVTVGGAFLTSDNTKAGTSGTLFAAEAFSGGDKSLTSGDTLSVTYTVSAADA